MELVHLRYSVAVAEAENVSREPFIWRHGDDNLALFSFDGSD